MSKDIFKQLSKSGATVRLDFTSQPLSITIERNTASYTLSAMDTETDTPLDGGLYTSADQVLQFISNYANSPEDYTIVDDPEIHDATENAKTAAKSAKDARKDAERLSSADTPKDAKTPAPKDKDK